MNFIANLLCYLIFLGQPGYLFFKLNHYFFLFSEKYWTPSIHVNAIGCSVTTSHFHVNAHVV